LSRFGIKWPSCGDNAQVGFGSSAAADLAPVIEDIRVTGANSLRLIAKELNGRGISAPRAGAWSAAQVRAVLVARFNQFERI
jgi:hypothetical protein